MLPHLPKPMAFLSLSFRLVVVVATTTATATKTSLKKWICAALNFIALIPSRLIRQMLAILLELNSKGLHQSSGREKESCCRLFPFSTKREIRQFHVVVVQWRQRNVQKSVLHVQSCCFPCLNLLIFFCSRCCRRRHCVNALFYDDDDDDGNENGNRIRLAKLHVQHAFLYLSLPSLHDYDVKMPIIMATFKIRNGEWEWGTGNGERGTGNEERGIFKSGNL